MNISFSWYLALRIRKSRSGNTFGHFVGSSSTLGIGLGCFVLILLLSVMNGFERELRRTLLAVIPHGELMAVGPEGLEDWQSIAAQIRRDPNIHEVAPVVKAIGLLQRGSNSKAVSIAALQTETTLLSSALRIQPSNAWQALQDRPDGIILGQSALAQIGLQVGDTVQVLLPQQSTDLKLSAPVYLWLTVVGSIAAGGELDDYLAYMNLAPAAEALAVTRGAQGLRLTLADPYAAPRIIRQHGYQLQQAVYMSDWTGTHGHLYQDILLVRSVVYLALILVLAVASFNIVSSLVMAVNDKQAEIAILHTMGASAATIAKVFIIQGGLNGLIGATLGSASGALVAVNLTQIILQVEQLVGAKLISGDIYFVDFLPSLLAWQDVAVTFGIALFLSLVAGIYPAWRASRIAPAKVLGH